jgi:2-succinyl-5-enolpyruvyl-6-hydroxy-3-cyclohexene-1-carboxylate synthase
LTQPNPSTAMARAVIDELARGGVTMVVASPGSRSAALVIAAAGHPRLHTRVVLDERSAAFFALGRAKASGNPVAVVSTSGTAPANYLPAVVEADMSLTPLVVLTADRPRELRGVGANQTIDQRRLFGDKVRKFSELSAPGSGTDLNHHWRSVAAEAVARARGWAGRPGPVHLNLAFREPTVPVGDDGRSRADPYPYPIAGRAGDRPWLLLPVPDPPAPAPLNLGEAARPMLVVGEGDFDRAGLKEQAHRLGWPVLATALSGMRDEGVVSSYHHVLASGVPDWLEPDLVVAVGALGPSSRLQSLVSAAAASVRVDRWGRRLDPERTATYLLHADPVAFLAALAALPTGSGWRDRWARADETARKAMTAVLDEVHEPSGAGTVRALADTGWETLVVASSLPIREVDAHLKTRGRVLANRGASGIDGFVSTARGVASAGRATVALSGDLSLLHDQNGLLPEESDDLVLVVLDNMGGGLFDSLPLPEHAPDYERLFLTPPRRDLELLARFHGIGVSTVTDNAGVTRAVIDALEARGMHLVRVPIDRGTDLHVRRALDEAAAGAV